MRPAGSWVIRAARTPRPSDPRRDVCIAWGQDPEICTRGLRHGTAGAVRFGLDHQTRTRGFGVGRAQAIARRGGIALLAATLVLVVGTVVRPAVLVLGDGVTSVGDAAAGLVGGGLGLLVLARVLGRVERRRGASALGEGGDRRSPGRGLGVGLLVVGAGAAAAFAWALDSTSVAVVLEPASAAGCRVVVQEHSFLMGGRGAVFALPRTVSWPHA